jgi:DNA polymerase-3 subunit epsilon
MIFFFDTETTGIPRNYKAPVTDLNNWPRVVQLAWLVYSQDESLVSSHNYIIRPDGFTIPPDSARVHGITQERALTEGVKLTEALEAFRDTAGAAGLFVAHNMSFDENILGAEFLRMKMEIPFAKKRKFCTMLSTVDHCRIPGKYGFKWPRLDELHENLFGTGFDEAHNALADIEATAKCFFEIKKRNLVRVPV